jgi:hypothetical protein
MKLTRKTTILMALLLALVSLVTAVAPALAAADDPTADTNVPVLRDGLAIVAPVAARPDQPVTMTVFQRSDQTPMEGAGVWAFTSDQAPLLEAEIDRLRESGTAMNADTDWESIVSIYGSFLGRTDARGKLATTFSEGGRYLLVAVKRGYLPGRTGIGIAVTADALAIRAPQQADVNEPVSLTVYEKSSGEPVQGAGIWAFTRVQAEALQNDIAAMRESDQTLNPETDWESLLAVRGVFLGRTGDNGELVTGFAEEGGYLLLAAKPRYLPARAGIRIGSQRKPLVLQVQGRARVNEEVPVHVMGRVSGEAVEGAGVWALTRDEAEALQREIEGLRTADTNLNETDFSALLNGHGFYLGATDERGNLVTGFSQPGLYVLVTWKPGYLPGFGVIHIVGQDADQLRPSDRPDAAEAAAVPDEPAAVGAPDSVTDTVQ